MEGEGRKRVEEWGKEEGRGKKRVREGRKGGGMEGSDKEGQMEEISKAHSCLVFCRV